LESFLIFSNSFTETWNDRQNCRNTWDSPARKKRKTVMRKHGWQLKRRSCRGREGEVFRWITGYPAGACICRRWSGCPENTARVMGRNRKAVLCVRNQEILIERKALDFSSAFRYNLVRSWSEEISDLPSV